MLVTLGLPSPSYLVTATSNFDWVTWIAPKNVIVNQIFGCESSI